MKTLKTILIIFGILAIAIFLFLKFANKDTKKEIFEGLGIEDSEMVSDYAIETFLEIYDASAHKNITNKWVINGWIRNSHTEKTVSSITFRVNFSDGNETVSMNKILNPGGLGKPFKIKLVGHKKADFMGIEVIGAD